MSKLLTLTSIFLTPEKAKNGLTYFSQHIIVMVLMDFIKGFFYLLFVIESCVVVGYYEQILTYKWFCYLGIFGAPLLAILMVYSVKREEENDKR